MFVVSFAVLCRYTFYCIGVLLKNVNFIVCFQVIEWVLNGLNKKHFLTNKGNLSGHCFVLMGHRALKSGNH